MESIPTEVLEPVQKMMDDLDVSSVFGEPTSDGDGAVIPVADVLYGYGYGFGGQEETGSGGGGGGGGKATPRGYLHITPDGVEFESIDNDTLIAVAGILMGAWSVFWTALCVITIAKSIARVRTSE